MKLLQCLCLNNSIQTVQFLINDNGLDTLNFLLEKVRNIHNDKINSWAKEGNIAKNL